MSQKYTEEFKKEVVKYYATGKSYNQIIKEYGVPNVTLAAWIKKYSEVMLHTDRGSQFTSYEFSEFCKLNNIIQSMSLPRCPYDNAVIERFYKIFKSEFIYKHIFYNDEDLDEKTNQYIHL